MKFKKALGIYIGVQVVTGLGVYGYLKYQDVKEERRQEAEYIKEMAIEIERIHGEYLRHRSYMKDKNERQKVTREIYEEVLKLEFELKRDIANSGKKAGDFLVDMEKIEAIVNYFKDILDYLENEAQ